MTKQVARSQSDAELAVVRAALEHDADAVHAGLAALGFFERDDPRFDPSHVLDHVRALNAWYANDETVTLTPQYVSSLLAHAGDPSVAVLGPDEERDPPGGITSGQPDAGHDAGRRRPAQRHRELAPHHV